MQYLIRSEISTAFPFETSRLVEDYGVLGSYVERLFDRDKMDEIICEMVKRHPYVSGAKYLDVCVLWIDEQYNGRFSGYYHRLRFINPDYEDQPRDETLTIRYEK